MNADVEISLEWREKENPDTVSYTNTCMFCRNEMPGDDIHALVFEIGDYYDSPANGRNFIGAICRDCLAAGKAPSILEWKAEEMREEAEWLQETAAKLEALAKTGLPTAGDLDAKFCEHVRESRESRRITEEREAKGEIPF